jgi:hypothetical protein
MAFPTMAGVHALIGIGEGIITALVLVAIARARPELIAEPTDPAPSRRYGVVAFYGVLIALGLALFISPLASESPDGLDKAAEKLGFDGKAKVVVTSPMPEYKIVRISAGKLGTSLAGAAGTAVVFSLSYLLARVLVPKSKPGGLADGASPQ